MSDNGFDIGPYRERLRLAIRYRREQLKFTQADAARLCEMERTDYAAAENGTSKTVTLERLLRLAESLGLRVDLRIWSGKRPPRPPRPPLGRPPKRKEVP